MPSLLMAMAVHRGGFISPSEKMVGDPFSRKGESEISLSRQRNERRGDEQKERLSTVMEGRGREGEGSPKATIPYVVVVFFVVVVARSQSSGRHVLLWTREEKNARYKLAPKFARVYVVLYNIFRKNDDGYSNSTT